MWPQQNLCEYPIVKMNMEQRPAANQSFLETIHSQVKQKTKSNYLNITTLMNTFLLFGMGINIMFDKPQNCCIFERSSYISIFNLCLMHTFPTQICREK